LGSILHKTILLTNSTQEELFKSEDRTCVHDHILLVDISAQSVLALQGLRGGSTFASSPA
jgi:hypothetical protein